MVSMKFYRAVNEYLNTFEKLASRNQRQIYLYSQFVYKKKHQLVKYKKDFIVVVFVWHLWLQSSCISTSLTIKKTSFSPKEPQNTRIVLKMLDFDLIPFEMKRENVMANNKTIVNIISCIVVATAISMFFFPPEQKKIRQFN